MGATFEHLVPKDGVEKFLTLRFGACADDVTIERLGEGHSNLTFLICRGSDAWVLRRPPRGTIQPGTHEMHREFAVMKALADSDSGVPVPDPIELCQDTDVIGAPFFLMSLVDGCVVRAALPPHLDEDGQRREITEELVDRLADIHEVDWQAAGLASMARDPSTFVQRNLERMQQLYEGVRHRDVPQIDEAGDWLRANTPRQREVSLTHGDYKLDNVILANTAPAKIVAVIDWEISTIGDPLVDLGWLLYFAPSGPGYLSLGQMAERYASRRGVEPSDLRFYAAMAGWKIAIIMEGSNHRFKQGKADDSMFAALDGLVPMLAARSLQIIAGEAGV